MWAKEEENVEGKSGLKDAMHKARTRPGLNATPRTDMPSGGALVVPLSGQGIARIEAIEKAIGQALIGRLREAVRRYPCDFTASDGELLLLPAVLEASRPHGRILLSGEDRSAPSGRVKKLTDMARKGGAMGSDLYLYRITRPPEGLPETIDLDSYPAGEFPYEYTEAVAAKDWEREIGVLREVTYMAVDRRAVVEKIFGERYTGCRYDGYVWTFYSDGKTLGALTDRDLDAYRQRRTVSAYVYVKDRIASVAGFYGSEPPVGLVTHDELVRCAEEIAREESEYCPFIGEKVWGLMAAAAAVADGGAVLAVCG